MSVLPRIYLDNAATSWPKPPAVYGAVDHALRQLGAPAGRSPYAEAMEVTRRVEAARFLARLFGIRDPSNLVFTSNGTDAINLAIHGLLQTGDHVITTVVEHNSVLRPLATLEEQQRISLARIDCNSEGVIDADDIQRALLPNTRLIVITHASNVTGALTPIDQVASMARRAGVPLLIDAAQTAGHVPINVETIGVDLLATSGHKGLLGPLGTGLLYIRPGLETAVAAIRQGGTGTKSDEDHQPTTMPSKYESGNLNVPGILGLGAGVEYLLGKSVAKVREHEIELTERLLAGLTALPGIKLFGPRSAKARVGLVSLTLEGYDPQEVAASLDATFRIQVRPGLHCAPHMHRALGTLNRGGTVRLSLGHFTTVEEIDATITALSQLATI